MSGTVHEARSWDQLDESFFKILDSLQQLQYLRRYFCTNEEEEMRFELYILCCKKHYKQDGDFRNWKGQPTYYSVLGEEQVIRQSDSLEVILTAIKTALEKMKTSMGRKGRKNHIMSRRSCGKIQHRIYYGEDVNVAIWENCWTPDSWTFKTSDILPILNEVTS